MEFCYVADFSLAGPIELPHDRVAMDPKRILIVAEPVRAYALIHQIELGGLDTEAMVVSSSDAMQREVLRWCPDVVLLDAHHDVLLFYVLRAMAPHLPVVVVTDVSNGTAVQALDDGAADVIVLAEMEPRLLAWRLRLAVDRHTNEDHLRAAKELAESASARKGEFVASLSHDLRAPLNTMLGMKELLGETSLSPKQRRYIDTLERAGEHMLSLLEEVLDLARIEAGHVTIEDVIFDVREVAASAIEIVRVHARAKKLELGFEVADDVPGGVRGDPRRLRQVLVNLLGNSVKFTDRGRVWLTMTREASHRPDLASLRFAVIDTGIGIPEDKVHSIFRGFEQADASINRNYGGFGLGLSIAKRIVERMGGSIWAESQPSKGSTFFVTLTLPAEERPKQPSLGSTKSAADLRLSSPLGRRLSVLVVDDSPDNRVLLGEYLEGAGVDVAFADDGPSALAMACTGAERAYDAVLMDLQMPQLDGYETTRELLRTFDSRGLEPPPIIALSAHVLADTFARSRDAGCILQLTKPIRKRALLETLARVCNANVSEAAPVAVTGRTTSADLKPLLPQYFANRSGDVVAIRAALRRGDLAIIKTLAHNMRGTGTSYGFPELSELAMRLENAVKAEALTLVATLADELEQIVASLDGQAEGRKKSGTHVRAQSSAEQNSFPDEEPSQGNGRR